MTHEDPRAYHLRCVAPSADRPALLELLSEPEVCRFLNDGAAPSRVQIEDWISSAVRASAPFGLWLLYDRSHELQGCVRLSSLVDDATSAELIYALHPRAWGQGLATRISRSAIRQAFATSSCGSILAGADTANHKSIEVMKRLGMRFLRDTQYPLGPGVEYRIRRSEFAQRQTPDHIPILAPTS